MSQHFGPLITCYLTIITPYPAYRRELRQFFAVNGKRIESTFITLLHFKGRKPQFIR